MKRVIFIGLLLWACCSACTEGVRKDRFVLSAELSGAGDKGSLGYTDTLQKFQWVPLEFQNGIIETELAVKEPTVVKLSFRDPRFMKMIGRGFIPTNSAYLMFVASPGMKLNIKGQLDKDFVDIYPVGDKENDILSKYTSALHPLLNEAVNMQIDTNISEEQKEQMGEKYEKQLQKIRMEFLDGNVSSIAGLWLLEDMLIRSQIEMEEAEIFFKKVSPEYSYSNYYKNIEQRIKGYKASAIGQTAPGIRTKNTYDGEEFDLENWRGKYVLIDFWGTWCGACIAGMPDMKAFAGKYPDKLMLLGIAKESDPERWKQYLKGEGAQWDWKQIISGQGDEDYVLRYNVQGYPTKILISPEGKVLKRIVGEEPGIYEEMEALIQ